MDDATSPDADVNMDAPLGGAASASGSGVNGVSSSLSF
jgi:hypothetical protein